MERQTPRPKSRGPAKGIPAPTAEKSRREKAQETINASGQFFLMFLIVLTFVYVIFQRFSPLVRVIVPIATAVAVYKTIQAAQASGKKIGATETRTWRLVAVCMGIWLAGEISVVIYFIRMGSIPYPSVAEGAYLLGYILMSAGAFSIIRKVNVKLPISHVMTFTSVVLLMSMVVTNFIIAKAIASPMNLLDKAFNIGLPVTDMMLIIVVFAIYFVYFGAGRKEELLEESWSIVILGMTFSAMADIITTYRVVNLVNSIYLVLIPGILYIWSRGVVGIGAKARV